MEQKWCVSCCEGLWCLAWHWISIFMNLSRSYFSIKHFKTRAFLFFIHCRWIKPALRPRVRTTTATTADYMPTVMIFFMPYCTMMKRRLRWYLARASTLDKRAISSIRYQHVLKGVEYAGELQTSSTPYRWVMIYMRDVQMNSRLLWLYQQGYKRSMCR